MMMMMLNVMMIVLSINRHRSTFLGSFGLLNFFILFLADPVLRESLLSLSGNGESAGRFCELARLQ